MDVINLIAQYGAWSWVVGGLALLALELVVPGGVFIWLGISAVTTGIVTLLVPLDWPVSVLIFGVLAVVTVAGWLKFRPHGEPSDRPLLNKRTAHFVGR